MWEEKRGAIVALRLSLVWRQMFNILIESIHFSRLFASAAQETWLLTMVELCSW